MHTALLATSRNRKKGVFCSRIDVRIGECCAPNRLRIGYHVGTAECKTRRKYVSIEMRVADDGRNLRMELGAVPGCASATMVALPVKCIPRRKVVPSSCTCVHVCIKAMHVVTTKATDEVHARELWAWKNGAQIGSSDS